MPGVTSCSVSLLTNSMGVEGTASASAIVKAVQEAGYGASPQRMLPPRRPSAELSMHWLTTRRPVSEETAHLHHVVFLAVLMYFSMGHMMWGWPLPACFRRTTTSPWVWPSCC